MRLRRSRALVNRVGCGGAPAGQVLLEQEAVAPFGHERSLGKAWRNSRLPTVPRQRSLGGEGSYGCLSSTTVSHHREDVPKKSPPFRRSSSVPQIILFVSGFRCGICLAQ